MKEPRSAFGPICTAIAIAAMPASAAASAYVPPGNSAATQYTEAMPTAGGPQATGKSPHRHSSPAKALGARNSHRLEAQGSAGRAAAEAAAATAPTSGASNLSPESGEPAPSGSPGGKAKNGSANPPSRGEGAGDDGSSGLAEVVGQGTGASSSGSLGLLLPIAILAAIAWALVYFGRRRRRPAP